MSTWLSVVCGVIAAGIVLAVLIAQFRTKRPIRGILKTGLQGVCALAAVDVAGIFTGVSLGLNVFTGLVSLVLGLPGVIGILLLNLIFI